MSLPISSDMKAWKAGETRDDPLVHLYDVEITDGLTLYLMAGAPGGKLTETYGGNTYTAAHIEEQESEQTIEYELRQKQIGISNVDGVAGGYIETYELDGRQVTIRRMTLSALRVGPTDADIILETWTILGQTYDRYVATVTLGPPPLFERRCPWRRFNRQRCGWDWERRFEVGNGCHYPSDEFQIDTRQDFCVGADDATEQQRQYGWWSLNVASFRADSTEVVVAVDEAGLEISGDATSLEWSTLVREAPFVFKILSGDFDVSTRVQMTDLREGLFAGILCQERGSGYDSWVEVGVVTEADLSLETMAQAALNGAGQGARFGSDVAYVRLKREGNAFTAYTSADGETWDSMSPWTLAIETEVRLGLVLACAIPATTLGGVRLDYFRFTTGGDAACDRTLTDCAAKGNAHRHFAFPGIPEK